MPICRSDPVKVTSKDELKPFQFRTDNADAGTTEGEETMDHFPSQVNTPLPLTREPFTLVETSATNNKKWKFKLSAIIEKDCMVSLASNVTTPPIEEEFRATQVKQVGLKIIPITFLLSI